MLVLSLTTVGCCSFVQSRFLNQHACDQKCARSRLAISEGNLAVSFPLWYSILVLQTFCSMAASETQCTAIKCSQKYSLHLSQTIGDLSLEQLKTYIYMGGSDILGHWDGY